MELKGSRADAVKRYAPDMQAGGSNAVQSSSSEQNRAGTAEYLLDLMTVDEIASALRVSPSWVYERVRRRGKDKMPHLKVGKYLRFRVNEVRTWVDRGEAR